MRLENLFHHGTVALYILLILAAKEILANENKASCDVPGEIRGWSKVTDQAWWKLTLQTRPASQSPNKLKFEAIVAVSERDFSRFGMLYDSLCRNAPAGMISILHVIVEHKNIRELKAKLYEYCNARCHFDVNVIDEKDVLPQRLLDHTSAWYLQQLLKLETARKFVKSEYFLVLDADVVVLRRLKMQDFFEGVPPFRAKTSMQHWTIQKDRNCNAFKILKVRPDPDLVARINAGEPVILGATPAMMSRTILLELIKRVEALQHQKWAVALAPEMTRSAATEYGLYSAAGHSTALMYEFFVPGDSNLYSTGSVWRRDPWRGSDFTKTLRKSRADPLYPPFAVIQVRQFVPASRMVSLYHTVYPRHTCSGGMKTGQASSHIEPAQPLPLHLPPSSLESNPSLWQPGSPSTSVTSQTEHPKPPPPTVSEPALSVYDDTEPAPRDLFGPQYSAGQLILCSFFFFLLPMSFIVFRALAPRRSRPSSATPAPPPPAPPSAAPAN